MTSTLDPPSRGSSALVALLTLAMDAAALGLATLFVAFVNLNMDPNDLPSPTTPKMDWSPLIAYGVPLALIALSAWWFARSGYRITAAAQVLLVVVVGGVVLAVTARDYRHANPPPRPIPVIRAPCYSGSGTCPGG